MDEPINAAGPWGAAEIARDVHVPWCRLHPHTRQPVAYIESLYRVGPPWVVRLPSIVGDDIILRGPRGQGWPSAESAMDAADGALLAICPGIVLQGERP